MSFKIDIYKFFLSVFLTMVLCLVSCTPPHPATIKTEHGNASAQDFPSLKKRLEYYALRGNLDSVVEFARPIYLQAAKHGYSRTLLYTASYLAQSYVFTDRYDSAKVYLRVAKECIDKMNKEDLFIKGMFYNTNAVFIMKTRMDYISALDYWKKSLAMATSNKDLTNECILLSNIASLYFQREDPEGLSYAQKAYEMGRTMRNPQIMLLNATHLAAIYNFTSDNKHANHYIQEALNLITKFPEIQHNSSLVYMVYGDILARSEDASQAENAYNTAIASMDKTNDSRSIKLYLSYADYLSAQNRFREAESKYIKGLEIANTINNVEYTHKLLKGLSMVYDHLGERGKALDYHKQYHDAYTRIFNLSKEQEFKNLLLKYEQVKHDEEIHLKDLEYAKVKMGIIIIAAIFLIVLIFLVYAYILYLKKEKMYTALATNYNKFSQRILELTNAEKERNENMNKTSRKLFDALEQLMHDEKIYRRKDLSLTMVGEMLHSNSTYVSKAINTCAGTTFLNYVNSYRMNEVVSILSDPENDTPLKAIADNAGYGNITSFYRYFEKETGCAPSKFRQKMRLLKNAKNEVEDL